MFPSRILIITCLVLISSCSLAQDKIFLRNGDTISCSIIEKNEKEISYKISDYAESPLIKVGTAKVVKIILKDGTELKFMPPGIRMDKRLAISAGLILPLDDSQLIYKAQIDYFIKPGVTLAINAYTGSQEGSGFAFGTHYYFNRFTDTKFKVFSGLMAGVDTDQFLFLAPIGLNFAGDKGLDLKIAVNCIYLPGQKNFGLYPDFLIGWRF